MSNQKKSSKVTGHGDGQWERICELEKALARLDRVVCDRSSFALGQRGRLRAERIQLAANEQARWRSTCNPEFNKNWTDALSDDDILFWMVGGGDKYVDILGPPDRLGLRTLLPDSTPLEFDNRNARFKSVIFAACGEVLKE